LSIAFYDYEKKCLNSDGQQFQLDINKANICHFSIYLMEHLKFMTLCYIHYQYDIIIFDIQSNHMAFHNG